MLSHIHRDLFVLERVLMSFSHRVLVLASPRQGDRLCYIKNRTLSRVHIVRACPAITSREAIFQDRLKKRCS